MIKRNVTKAIIGLAIILLFAHGFSEGMEWHRLAACVLGGFLLYFMQLK